MKKIRRNVFHERKYWETLLKQFLGKIRRKNYPENIFLWETFFKTFSRGNFFEDFSTKKILLGHLLKNSRGPFFRGFPTEKSFWGTFFKNVRGKIVEKPTKNPFGKPSSKLSGFFVGKKSYENILLGNLL